MRTDYPRWGGGKTRDERPRANGLLAPLGTARPCPQLHGKLQGVTNPWDRIPVNDETWSRARGAIGDNLGRDGYADVNWVAQEFGGERAGLDRGAAAYLLERFNEEYRAEPNAFEQHPSNCVRWKNA